MCGIAGILSSPGQYTMAHVQSMTQAIAHRGPDGEHHWQNAEGTVLFGHRRLAIIDLSNAAAQPMQRREQESHDLVIVYNGEIYNYKEIRQTLLQKGHHFFTQSDTEVILAAYQEYGAACVDHFDGMFAFAIWDGELQELFAARDRFGEKPFFYHFDNGLFLFGSEMKALWAAGVPREHNSKMLFNFLTIGYTGNPADPGETFFTNIRKLPAASCLYYKPGSTPVIEKYWEIDSNQQQKISDDEALATFDHLLRQSVHRRLRSDVRIGTSLSGGLDSSTIAALIHAENYPQLTAFTATFPGFERDELAHAQQVCNQFGFAQQIIAPDAGSLADNWDKICYYQEEPFGSSSIFAQFSVYELAAQHHTKVLIDGQGADELMAGYTRYYKWYWQELFRKRKLLRSGELKAARDKDITESFGFRNVIAALFPDIAAVILEQRYLLHALKQKDLTRDFVKLQSQEAYYTTPEIFNLNGALHFNAFTNGLEELLRYADRNSMAHGVEVRLPFLSHELAEFLFTLPSDFKIRNGWSKWLLRENMKDRLPEAITWRKDKTGFEPPQKKWMSTPSMTALIHEAKNTLVQEKILRPSVLDKPVKAAPAHDSDNYDWRYLAAAFIIQK
ncbi:asparagine synthase (glutamine-hydrolyzing) [Nostoc ellipsosporum NOK]|nr:asparagine synthase (glutamine-hydrolyzing) [Nostoc ellipsosporum NOK]